MTEQLDLENVRIYLNTQGDILCAFTHIGEEVYLSNDKDFETYIKGELIGVSYICGDSVWGDKDNPWAKYPFVGRTDENSSLEKCSHYKYFILAKDAKFKEKKLRPFKTVQEFIEGIECEIGDTITYKKKNSDAEYTVLINGYVRIKDNIEGIYLGRRSYTPVELRDDYVYLHVDEWKSFGVEE